MANKYCEYLEKMMWENILSFYKLNYFIFWLISINGYFKVTYPRYIKVVFQGVLTMLLECSWSYLTFDFVTVAEGYRAVEVIFCTTKFKYVLFKIYYKLCTHACIISFQCMTLTKLSAIFLKVILCKQCSILYFREHMLQQFVCICLLDIPIL